MKRFNLHDMYEVGRALGQFHAIQGNDLVIFTAFNLWMARQAVTGLIAPGSVLLNSARRAAQPIVTAINAVLPETWDKVLQIPNDEQINDGRAFAIRQAITDFETVLRSEMPDVAAYVVAQKGIFRTDDLIANADMQIASSLVGLLPPQSLADVKAAGKCLAFELGTACAFHLWRAVEAVIGWYYQQVAGQTFDEAKVNRNWGAYIQALEKASADSKVTMLLKHIKDEFRNPQTHPEESVKVEEAQRLFSVAMSAIEQMLASGYELVTSRAFQGGAVPPPPIYELVQVHHTFAKLGAAAAPQPPDRSPP